MSVKETLKQLESEKTKVLMAELYLSLIHISEPTRH